MFTLMVKVEFVTPSIEPEKAWNGRTHIAYEQLINCPIEPDKIKERLDKIIKAVNDL